MLTCRQLDPSEEISVEIKWKYSNFHTNSFENAIHKMAAILFGPQYTPCVQLLVAMFRVCTPYHIWIHRSSPYISGCSVLTYWGRDKMAASLQTIFSNAFSWMKIYEFLLRFHWSLFLRVQLTIFHHWFRWWLGADQATSHYLNQWWSLCQLGEGKAEGTSRRQGCLFGTNQNVDLKFNLRLDDPKG